MRKSIFIILMFTLAGCIPPPEPVVSEFNGDSVKVQIASYGDPIEARKLTLAEANRICGRRGLHAEYASTRTLPDYNIENLYLCL